MIDPCFDGWLAIKASGMNESGQIVGQAKNVDTGETRGFMFDPQGPQCVLLPPPLHSPGQTAREINNFGDILASEGGGWITQYTWDASNDEYVLTDSWQKNSSIIVGFNDSGQILLVNGLRYTPGIGWEDFSATTYGIKFYRGMSNIGAFVGAREEGKGKFPTRFCYRFTDGDPDEMLDIVEGAGTASDVNSDGDVCLIPGHRGFIYTDEDGLWALDNMVTGDPADVEDWGNALFTYVRKISDRDETGFRSICGRAVFSTKFRGKTTTTVSAFLLTPVLP